MTLGPDELERYARHIVLREIGGPGQARLRRARIAMIGAGGLGAPALLYLAAAGVGFVRLIDDDAVSLSNLQRQVIFRTGDIGRAKAEAAAAAAMALNPGCVVESAPERLSAETAARLLADVDLVLDGSDNFATRRAVNRAAVAAGVPLLSGALGQWDGQLALFDPAKGGPCYACVFPKDPGPGLAPSCAEAGIMGALAGVLGAWMAAEAIKHLARAGEPLLGRLLLYDALSSETRTLSVARDPACAICGAHADG